MSIKDLPTTLAGMRLFELPVYRDERGFFMERYREDRFHELGLKNRFVQDNHSFSAPGVLRGLHYQTDPAQGKLVSCIRGRIFDVGVDLRKGSPTFGKWFGAELSGDNGRVMWVPFGFAHGFCVVGDEPADVIYKVDGVYNPKTEGGLRWNDPDVAIQWPVKEPRLATKDTQLPSLKDVKGL